MSRRRGNVQHFRKGRPRRKGRKKKRRFTTGTMIRGLANVRTGGFLGIEVKFYDNDIAKTSVLAVANMAGLELDPASDGLNTVIQGDGEQNRDGRQMSMKSIFINGQIHTAAQTGVTPLAVASTVVVIYLILDTQTNGAALNSEDVLVNSGGQTWGGINAMRNLQFTKRFKVLAKKTIVLVEPQCWGVTASGDCMATNTSFSMFAKLGGMITNFSGTTEAIANITDNSIHLIGMTDNVTLVPQLSYNSRLRFEG